MPAKEDCNGILLTCDAMQYDALVHGKPDQPDAASSGAGVPPAAVWGPSNKPWATSTARRKALLASRFIATLGGMALAVTIIAWVNASLRTDDLPLGVAAPVVSAMLFGAAYIRFTLARIRYEEQGEAAAREAYDKEIEGLPPAPALVDLMRLNRKQIDQYHLIARHQSQNAYRNSQIAMAIGLLMIIVAFVAAIVPKQPTSKLVYAGLSIVGTVVSLYISRTFLRVHESASEQFQRASNEPMVGAPYLEAERIADKLPDDRREEQLVRIIETRLLQAVEYAGVMPVAAPGRYQHSRGRPYPAEGQWAEEGPWPGESTAPVSARARLSRQRLQALRGPLGKLSAPPRADADGNMNSDGGIGDRDNGDDHRETPA